MGYMKGKSAIHIARTYGGKRRNFVGQHFWARGYWVSTVGHNEAAVRLYIREQEKEDQRLDQLGLFESQSRFERFTISSLWLCRRSLTHWPEFLGPFLSVG
jgi:putative transposase